MFVELEKCVVRFIMNNSFRLTLKFVNIWNNAMLPNVPKNINE